MNHKMKMGRVKNLNDSMQLFPFNEIFCFQRGRRLIEADQVEGDIAYISSTKTNNGVSAYITPPDTMNVYSNKLTLSNSGSVGYCFFHTYNFVASDHVTVIWIKDKKISLSRNLALYLKPILESMRYKYNFGREISDNRLKKERILLPATNNEPDWNFMDGYVENMKKNIKWSQIPTLNSSTFPLSNENWAEFKMGIRDKKDENALFVIKKGKRLVKADMQPGKTHFIGAISSDNGIRQLIDEEPIFEGNCITVNYNGSVGEAFYQEKSFWACDDVNVLYPQNWWKMNRYIAMFIIAVIKENRYLFSYGRKWNSEKMENSKLKLPIDVNGKPNFEFMEKYTRSLPYADKI